MGELQYFRVILHHVKILLRPRTDKLDRAPGDFADGEGRASARVAIQLGQDRARDANIIVERLHLKGTSS